jgi:uncharacterized SAM-binding protein YcdF (DUF218 family)
MFVLSKVLWAVFQPSSFIALVLFSGALLFLFRSLRRAAKFLLLSGAFLYILCGYSPLGNWLLIPLEFSVSKAAPSELDGAAGIIVLGGAVQTGASPDSEPKLNEAANRMTEAVRLATLYPSIPLIFSGGKAELFPSDMETESEAARRFFAQFHIEPPRLRLEDRSRNTAENALYSAKLLQPQPGQKWILVTSAFHMLRAAAHFRARGFQILPWPVDYRSGGWDDFWHFFPQASEGLRQVDLAAKEWTGLGVAWLRGQIRWTFPEKANARSS